MIPTKCIRLNARSAIFIVLSLFMNNISYTHTANNHMDTFSKTETLKNSSNADFGLTLPKTQQVDDINSCPSGIECNKLDFPCIKCYYNFSCLYGKRLNVTCEAKQSIQCQGNRNFTREMTCKYCYQSDLWEYECLQKANCNSVNQTYIYRTNCSVHANVLCLGNRIFFKNIRCNWTQGYKWSTALIISITLGGFGADRFYLGHWEEGIGKLFSFGGLGVWTLIDVILISLHYLGPADGSLYI